VTGISLNRRTVWPIAVMVVIGAGIGVWDAVSGGPDNRPQALRLVIDEADASVTGPEGQALGQVHKGDVAVEFPAALSDLPFSPTHLAVDPKTGDLWFMEFSYRNNNTLHQFNVSTDKLESFSVPASKGSELYSAIAIDERGHVISAEGFVVLDFDPSSGAYKEHPLPDASPYAHKLSDDAPYITDIALAGDGQIYISRFNVGAIAHLDLDSGDIKEIPLPKDFGQAYDIAYDGGSLWVTSRWDVDSGPPAQTGRLDVSSAKFTLIPGTAISLDAGAGKTWAVSAEPNMSVASVDDSGLSPASDSDSAKAAFSAGLSGLLDYIVIDQASGAAWAAGDGAGTIVRVEAPGAVRAYELPSYEGPIYPRCAEGVICPDTAVLKTSVGGLAVGEGGDLWFSDQTRNRIGVIRANR
jgi:streptogramin lyase